VKLGDVVIVKNGPNFNGSTEHPAIVTRVWAEDMVNLALIPDLPTYVEQKIIGYGSVYRKDSSHLQSDKQIYFVERE